MTTPMRYWGSQPADTGDLTARVGVSAKELAEQSRRAGPRAIMFARLHRRHRALQLPILRSRSRPAAWALAALFLLPAPALAGEIVPSPAGDGAQKEERLSVHFQLSVATQWHPSFS